MQIQLGKLIENLFEMLVTTLCATTLGPKVNACLCFYVCLCVWPWTYRNLTTPCRYGLTRKRRLKVSTWPPRGSCGPANNFLRPSGHIAHTHYGHGHPWSLECFLWGVLARAHASLKWAYPHEFQALCLYFLFFKLSLTETTGSQLSRN